MFELICNVLLFVFLGFTYFTHVLEAKVPKSYLKNPNVLHPSVWPKVIIILLLICIAINIIKIIKKNKGNPEFTFSAFCKNSVTFFKSRMFLGMIILVVAGAPGLRGDRRADSVLLRVAAGRKEMVAACHYFLCSWYCPAYRFQRPAGRQSAPWYRAIPAQFLSVPGKSVLRRDVKHVFG